MTNEEIYGRFEATRDEKLIALLFERNRGLIGRVLKKNGFIVDTEDVLQDGYIKVHAGLLEGKYSLQNNTKITAWMIRVVLNNAIGTYRTQKKEQESNAYRFDSFDRKGVSRQDSTIVINQEYDIKEDTDRLAIIGLYKMLNNKNQRTAIEYRLMGIPFNWIGKITNTKSTTLRVAFMTAVASIRRMSESGERNEEFGNADMLKLERRGLAIKKEHGIVMPTEKRRDSKLRKANRRADMLSKKHGV